jgi:sialic acid synthase SpsE
MKKQTGKTLKTFFIAEIGKNFIQTKKEQPIKEYLDNAKKLIKAAKEAGADAVKFQTHNVDDEQLQIKIVSPHFSGSDRYSWVKRNTEITTLKFLRELKKYCDKLNIIFFSTPMSRGAAMKLEKVVVPMWKIGSGDMLDFVMLDYIAQTRKSIIFSCGMSTLEEIDQAVAFMKKRKAKFSLLHCVSKYPCPPEDLNLKTINFLQQRYRVPVGFSDHSIGFESVLAAVELGAEIIEKHFSFSRDLWGSDHKVSMTPAEFKEMVLAVRSGRKSKLTKIGKKCKILQKGEAIFRPFFRKSLMAGCNIPVGTVLTKEMIYAMRPQIHAKGLPSQYYEKVVGKRIKKALKKYDPITKKNLE